MYITRAPRWLAEDHVEHSLQQRTPLGRLNRLKHRYILQIPPPFQTLKQLVSTSTLFDHGLKPHRRLRRNPLLHRPQRLGLLHRRRLRQLHNLSLSRPAQRLRLPSQPALLHPRNRPLRNLRRRTTLARHSIPDLGFYGMRPFGMCD